MLENQTSVHEVESLHQLLSTTPPDPKVFFSLQGQVVHSRKLSKKLFFFDVRLGKSEETGNCCEKIECITRYDEVSLVEVDLFWRTFKLGDKVKILGTFEKLNVSTNLPHGDYLFHVRDISVCSSWSAEVPFVPERPFREVANKKRGSQGQETLEEGVCKYWINTGRCQVSSCPYKHPTNPEELTRLRKKWVTERLETRRRLNISEEDPHSNEQKQSHRLRAKSFVDWLIQTYSIEYLNSGRGVLDVAGGRGDISFELHTKRGIRTTLIEPREMKLTKAQRKFLQLKNASPEDVKGTLSKQIRTIIDSNFIKSNLDLIQGCSIIIGMHPDQATEPIVNTALEFGKPFAVVPCCVFGHENPQRRLRDGSSVNQYEEFVQYLMEKQNPHYPKFRTKKDFMNITGRNQVIFCLPYVD